MKIERSAYLDIPAAVLPTRGLLLVAAGDPVGHGDLGPDERLKLRDVCDDDLRHVDSSDLVSLPKNYYDDKLETLLGQGRVAQSARGGLIGGRLTTPPLRGTPPQRGGDN